MRKQWSAHLICKVWILTSFLGTSSAYAHETLPFTSKDLDPVVADVCKKQVVLLGEDANHGAGSTFAIKSALVKRLIDDCGFSAVMFESQIYDFIDFQNSIANGAGSEDQLADAMGGFWSTPAETQALISSLFADASAERIRIFGLDPQVVGITQLYSQYDLPAALTGRLKAERKTECANELSRFTQGLYDDQIPYDEGARNRLSSCLAEIERLDESPDPRNIEIQARNLRRFIDFPSDSRRSGFNARDVAMFDNFVWFKERLPENTKIIVWCATIHAAKEGATSDIVPMGQKMHELLGDDAAAIGFSARTGAQGGISGTPSALVDAPAGSLEAKSAGPGVRYLDREKLDSLGAVPARAFNYFKFQTADWGRKLDGLVLMERESPPNYLRKPGPRRKRPHDASGHD